MTSFIKKITYFSNIINIACSRLLSTQCHDKAAREGKAKTHGIDNKWNIPVSRSPLLFLKKKIDDRKLQLKLL
jgi:hypothetical protein